jgi:uncharacterized protein DUF4199
MKKIVIVCGLISGGIVSALMGISIFIVDEHRDYNTSMVIGYATMVLAFSLIFAGIKIFRDKYNGGVVSFGKAFLAGLYISLIASTIYVATWALEYKYVFPDFMEKYSAHMIKEVKASGAGEAQVAEKLKQMNAYSDMYKNPMFFTLMTYAEILPVGIIISLISALILKRKNKMAQAAV